MKVLKTVVALGIVSILAGCSASPEVQQARGFVE